MKQLFKSKLFWIAIIIGVIILILAFKSSIGKDFVKKFIDTKEVELNLLQKEYDSIQLLRDQSIQENEELKQKWIELEQDYEIEKEKYNRLKNKYNAEINNYRNSNFDERFKLFSKLINKKDSIQ